MAKLNTTILQVQLLKKLGDITQTIQSSGRLHLKKVVMTRVKPLGIIILVNPSTKREIVSMKNTTCLVMCCQNNLHLLGINLDTVKTSNLNTLLLKVLLLDRGYLNWFRILFTYKTQVRKI